MPCPVLLDDGYRPKAVNGEPSTAAGVKDERMRTASASDWGAQENHVFGRGDVRTVKGRSVACLHKQRFCANGAL